MMLVTSGRYQQRRNTAPSRASPDLMSRGLNRQIHLPYEPIHRSADRNTGKEGNPR
jgi:hypothetical protein